MSRNKRYRWTLAAIIPIVLAANAAAARAQQADTAIVIGTIQDATEAPLPGATVTLVHLGTNAPTVVVTDARGQYRTPPIRIGDYEIGVELGGFKRFTRRG